MLLIYQGSELKVFELMYLPDDTMHKSSCTKNLAARIFRDVVTPNTFIFIMSLVTGGHFYVHLAPIPELFSHWLRSSPTYNHDMLFSLNLLPVINSFCFLQCQTFCPMTQNFFAIGWLLVSYIGLITIK
jgi:hypothetical protein